MGNCSRCHTGDIRPSIDKFSAMFEGKQFPYNGFGNGIDWMSALRQGLIKPRPFLKVKSQDMAFEKLIVLNMALSNTLPSPIFPHKSHIAWLDCSNCHPDIFNIEQRTTHFSMIRMARGEFCATCHLGVAFPMQDCVRCHPAQKQ